MARDQFGDDINPYDLSHVAAVRKGTLYPTPREPHSAADLLRPLAADNAQLQRERNAMEARIAELEAQRDALLETCEMVFPVLCGLLMEKWGADYNAPREAQGYVVYAALKSAIAKVRGEGQNDVGRRCGG